MQFQWDSGFTNKLLLLQNPNRTKSFKIGQSIASSEMDTIPSWEVRKVFRKGTGQDRIRFLAQEEKRHKLPEKTLYPQHAAFGKDCPDLWPKIGTQSAQRKKKLRFVVGFIFPYRLQANICALQFLQKNKQKKTHTLENTCVFAKMQHVMPFLTRKHLKCITKATSVVYGPLKVVHRHIFHIEHNFFPQILYYETRSIAPREEYFIYHY